MSNIQTEILPEDKLDFKIGITLPCGHKLKVLVPKDLPEEFPDVETYGLNLVTNGHYS